MLMYKSILFYNFIMITYIEFNLLIKILYKITFNYFHMLKESCIYLDILESYSLSIKLISKSLTKP